MFLQINQAKQLKSVKKELVATESLIKINKLQETS